jgi:hypothetical protein
MNSQLLVSMHNFELYDYLRIHIMLRSSYIIWEILPFLDNNNNNQHLRNMCTDLCLRETLF